MYRKRTKVPLSHMGIDCESIYSSSSAVKQTSKTLRKINSSGTFVLSLLILFTIRSANSADTVGLFWAKFSSQALV